MVIRPVFELLAGIANEPTCEVDEYSLAILFSPILFLDQSTTTPASLANPLPARAVELLVRTALRDLQSHQSLDRTFRVPVLFQKDCVRNLTQHMMNQSTQFWILAVKAPIGEDISDKCSIRPSVEVTNLQQKDPKERTKPCISTFPLTQ
ncbi:hypothetical protein X801_05877 [Opisthorchis viverrini]|uniref:Uncharacterized protein n=1 Tax=Opisthorchis viverrini TaxID=6198 RepID=A0A1S8WV82_OPIVI|nr:hypothetical protein X801_05877 [Opisthorchis viverrini]